MVRRTARSAPRWSDGRGEPVAFELDAQEGGSRLRVRRRHAARAHPLEQGLLPARRRRAPPVPRRRARRRSGASPSRPRRRAGSRQGGPPRPGARRRSRRSRTGRRAPWRAGVPRSRPWAVAQATCGVGQPAAGEEAVRLGDVPAARDGDAGRRQRRAASVPADHQTQRTSPAASRSAARATTRAASGPWWAAPSPAGTIAARPSGVVTKATRVAGMARTSSHPAPTGQPDCGRPRLQDGLALDPAEHAHHAPQPQRRDGLAEREAVRGVVGDGEHLVDASGRRGPRAGSRRTRAWSVPPVGAEKNRCTGRLPGSSAGSSPTSTTRNSGDWHSWTCSISPSRPAYRSGRSGRPSLNSSSSSRRCGAGRSAKSSAISWSAAGRGVAVSAHFSTGTRTALPHSVHEPS